MNSENRYQKIFLSEYDICNYSVINKYILDANDASELLKNYKWR